MSYESESKSADFRRDHLGKTPPPESGVSSLHLYVDKEGVIKVIQDMPVEPKIEDFRKYGIDTLNHFNIEHCKYKDALSKVKLSAITLRDQEEGKMLIEESIFHGDPSLVNIKPDTIYPIEGYEVRIEKAKDWSCELCKYPIEVVILVRASITETQLEKSIRLFKEYCEQTPEDEQQLLINEINAMYPKSGVSSPDKKVEPKFPTDNEIWKAIQSASFSSNPTDYIHPVKALFEPFRKFSIYEQQNTIVTDSTKTDLEKITDLINHLEPSVNKLKDETGLEQEETQAVRFAMYMSGKTTIGDQDYFRQVFRSKHWTTWKIDN